MLRLALRNPSAPKADTLEGEIGRTVDLVLHLGFGAGQDGTRERRLRTLGFVDGLEVSADPTPRVREKLAAAGFQWRLS